ncbi:MAG: CpsB/CapC family capsule biosynthesis tyrosine phosphatase [Frisingicoccus sp.]
MDELVHMGIYIQINARSVTGGNGWQCKSCAKKLLKQELVHFVASDGHDTKKRRPVLLKAMTYIAKRYGKKYALQLSVENPGKVISDIFID